MTIKSKLVLNVLIVCVTIGAVAVAGSLGMWFIKGKLFYLTERSTPFQMRTVEFQRSLQGATTGLVKVAASEDRKEYDAARAEAEKALAEVKVAKGHLEALTGGKTIESYAELERISAELNDIVARRIKAEEEAAASRQVITQRLADTIQRLLSLKEKISNLQSRHSTSLVYSLETTTKGSQKLRALETLKSNLKDLQIALYDINRAGDKKALLIARGRFNATYQKASQNDQVQAGDSLRKDLEALAGRAEEMIKVQTALFGQPQPSAETKGRLDTLNREASEKLSAVLLAVEQDVIQEGEKYSGEVKKQTDSSENASMATSVLVDNAELAAAGLTLEGLTSRLFTATTAKEVDAIQSEQNRTFSKSELTSKSLRKALHRLGAKEELAILDKADASLQTIRGLLMAGDGIVAKIRNRLEMNQKAAAAAESLRQMVIRQAEKGKESVTVAQGEQEQAIGSVNSMVTTSIALIVAIGGGSILFGIVFGIWVYRSIGRPLNNLIGLSEGVAKGDLRHEAQSQRKDEIGTVQGSMGTMVTSLRKITGKIKGATDSVASSSDELSATADALEGASKTQATQIEQAVTAITEMSQTTEDMARNAAHTADAADRMKSAAEGGKQTMARSMREIEAFAGAVNESAEKFEGLGKRSQEINAIVTLIKEIADQTNLLALNAAIEAARAGEQGRGFAVVADSVRQLAERTTGAANDIAERIGGMEQEITGSVKLMRAERESLTRVLGHIEGAARSLDDIVSAVESVADMVQRIAAATEQQSSASRDVAHNMDTIAVATRQLSGSTGEIKRAAADLAALASELKTTTSWFKV